jgi:hypothetical protein
LGLGEGEEPMSLGPMELLVSLGIAGLIGMVAAVVLTVAQGRKG